MCSHSMVLEVHLTVKNYSSLLTYRMRTEYQSINIVMSEMHSLSMLTNLVRAAELLKT